MAHLEFDEAAMESVLSCHPEYRYASFGGDPPTDMTAHPPAGETPAPQEVA